MFSCQSTLLPFFFSFRSAQIVRLQRQSIGEFSGAGEFPAEQVNVCRSRAPVLLVEEADAIGFEFFLVIQKAVAEQADRLVRVCELFEELRGGQ